MMDDCGVIHLGGQTSTWLAETADQQLRLRSSNTAEGCRTRRVLRNDAKKTAANPNSALALVMIFQMLIGQLAWASMNLPGGIENVLGFVPRSTFQCERDGYFGDIDNDCKIFHLCQRQVHPNGRTEWRHWTYACGNQTMFNQLTLTCAFVDEAIPCKHASQFQYLNEVIHRPAEPFLTDADVTSGISYYSNRIMSDGARARAFEDSQLLAQIGGSGAHHKQHQHQHHQLHQHHQQHLRPATLPGDRSHQQAPSSSAAASVSSRQLDTNSLSTLSLPAATPDESSGAGLERARPDSGPTESGLGTSEKLQTSMVLDSQQAAELGRQLAGLGSTRATGQTQPFADQGLGLIENHSLQLEHHGHAPTQFSSSSLSSAPISEPAPVSSSGRLGLVGSSQAAGLAVDQQQPFALTGPLDGQQASSGADSVRSFGFSIATNHQLGVSAEQTHQTSPVQAPAADLLQPVTATILGSSSASATEPQTGASTTTPSSDTGATNTSQSGPSARPAPGTAAALGRPQPGRVVVRRRLVNGNRAHRHHQRASGGRDRARELRAERTQLGFHSSRLSSAKQQVESRGAGADTALVMRREPVTPASGGANTATIPVDPIGEPQPVWPSDEFWRRPFDAQLLNPKFESLLTRKRV